MNLSEPFRLKYVHHGDFRCNEATLRDHALEEGKKYGVTLKGRSNEAILAVSANGKMVIFLLGVLTNKTISAGGVTNGQSTRVLVSLKYRILDGGRFNQYMIAHYAEALGIKLERIKSLAQKLRMQGNA